MDMTSMKENIFRLQLRNLLVGFNKEQAHRVSYLLL